MTTGSKGLHVVIPIQPKHDFDQIRTFAREKAQQLVNKYPDKIATQLAKEKRGNRVFLDYLRNAFGQTAVAPYSLRAIENAPVATPLDWSELSSLDNAQKYNHFPIICCNNKTLYQDNNINKMQRVFYFSYKAVLKSKDLAWKKVNL